MKKINFIIFGILIILNGCGTNADNNNIKKKETTKIDYMSPDVPSKIKDDEISPDKTVSTDDNMSPDIPSKIKDGEISLDKTVSTSDNISPDIPSKTKDSEISPDKK